MVLRKQTIPLRVGGGVLEDVDDVLLDTPQALEATNARFDKQGAVGKRAGQALREAPGDDDEPGSARTIVETQGSMAVLHDQGCFAYDTLASEWTKTNESSPRPSQILTDALIRTGNLCRQPDIAASGNIVCVVWADATTSECFYAFFDARYPTKILAGPTAFGSSVTSLPKVLVVDGVFVAVAMAAATGANGTIYGFTMDPFTPGYAFGSGVSIRAPGSTCLHWDVCLDGLDQYTLCFQSGNDSFFQTQDPVTHVQTNSTMTATSVSVLAVAHNPIIRKIVALGDDGSIAWIHDNYVDAASGATVTVPITPVTSTATSGRPIERGTLCVADDEGRMFCALSGRGKYFATNGRDELGTDIAELEAALTLRRQGYVHTLAIATKAFPLFDAYAVTPVVAAAPATPQDIFGASLTGCFDYRSGTMTGATWTDQVNPTVTDLVQANASNQAGAGATIGGRASLRFEAANSDRMDGGTFDSRADATAGAIWVVGRAKTLLSPAANASDDACTWASDGLRAGATLTTGGSRGFVDSTGLKQTAAAASPIGLNEEFVQRWSRSATTVRLKMTGAAEVTVAAGATSNMSLNWGIARNYNGDFTDVEIAAVYTVDIDPSAGQLTQMDAWILDKFGLAG